MLETPATQAAVPLITDDLNKTNTEIAQISSISAILAPILGGVIYNTFSINKIIIFSIIGFGITAFLESLIKMKNEQCIRDGNNEDGIAKALWRFVYKETQCSLIA